MLQIEIKVAAHIDPGWAEWFDEFLLRYDGKDFTVIEGNVTDQAALYGLLSKLRDLGLTLVSIKTSKHGIDQ